MKISKSQRWTILQLWSQVCKERGWKAGDRALRLATLGGILGRELTTLDDVGRIDECTKLMNELKARLGVSVQAGKEACDQGINRARNLRWVVMKEILPCLALYEPDATQYLTTVLTGKSRWRKTDRPEREPVLEDFDEPALKQVLMTLNARLHAKRRAAGHSIHDMKLIAGVKCDCAECSRPRVGMVKSPVAVEMASGDPDWNV